MKYLALLCLPLLIALQSFAQVDLTSSNLPIVIVDAHGEFISNEPKTMADMGVIDNGPGQINNITDPFNGYNGKIGIEIRGSSSQMFPKKPYGFELRDENGVGISAPLLGMPAEEDWVLIATYNDKTLMRDALAYKLGRDMGRYAPRTRFVELVFKRYETINGNTVVSNDYQGIYMLAEKIKRDENRVNISKLNPEEVSGDDVTGGYILKIDKMTGNSGQGFESIHPPLGRSDFQTINFQYEYPKYNEIVPQQKGYIQTFMSQFENALKSSTYDDPVNGYAKYIDVDAFIDFLIINEISRNVDGYRLSTFMHKDKQSDGGKLTMGPVWDFNLTFGNADYCSGGDISGWAYKFNSVCPGDYWLVPFWWDRLLSDRKFSQRLGRRWLELRQTKLSTDVIFDYVDSVANVLSPEATYRNFIKWPVLGVYIWPNQYVGASYDAEVVWMKSWINTRMLWLDMNMPRGIVTAEEENEVADLDFSISPNPVKEAFDVQYYLKKPATVKIEISDGMGRLFTQRDFGHRETGEFKATINAADLADGLYVVRVTTSNYELGVQRIVKKR